MTERATETNSQGLIQLLRPLLSGRRRQVSGVTATALGTGIAEAAALVMVTRIAFALSQGNDRVSFGGGPVVIDLPIVRALLLTAAVIVVRGATQTWNGYQAARLVTDVLRAARAEMASAYLNSSWARQSQERGGRLQELLTTYVTRVAKVVDAVVKGITSGLSLLALAVTSILVSPVAALALLVAVVLLGLTLQPLRRLVRWTSRGEADTGLDFATEISEISGLGQEIQIFGVEHEVDERVRGLIDANSEALRRQSFVSFMFTPLYATVLLLLLVGALGAIRASGTSDLASLGAVMVMMIRSLAYAQQAQAVYSTLQSSQPYLADLSAQLEEYRTEAVDRSGTDVGDLDELRFDGVGFSYPPAGFALRDLSFTIRSGESVGIIGPSGSGKSTLVQLLLRLRTPTTGAMSANGIPAQSIAIDDWRRRVAFVPQEARLIAGTIAENIRFFRPNILDERIEAAARAANIHDEILALTGGYDTQVGGTAVHLSGGQRQRICIARALATDPDLLVLDEPTSALDARSEARIRDTLSTLHDRVAVVIIAHRLSTLDSCDRMMVVQDGRIVAFDRREVLEESSDFYREALELSGIVPTGRS